jgi:putative transcription antitermination factor YqgF
MRQAQPVKTLHLPKRAEQVAQAVVLIREWEASSIVVGCAIYEDGSAHPTGQMAARFARQVASAAKVPFTLVDERLSSNEVKGMRARDGSSDAFAAAVILQQYFNTIA